MAPPLSGGSASSAGDAAKFGVLTISDRASAGVYEDLSGPAILQFFAEAIDSPWQAVYRVVPDEQPLIEQAIIDMVGPPIGRAGRPATHWHDQAAAPQHVAISTWGPRDSCCIRGPLLDRLAPSGRRPYLEWQQRDACARPPLPLPCRWTPRAAAWWSPPAAPGRRPAM